MKKIDLSVIVLSWNTKKLLKDCLNSIYKSLAIDHRPPDTGRRLLITEVIVVDNGSSDGSSQMVAKEFPEVKLIKNKKNLGFAKGNNQALKQALGEAVMLLNSDTIIKGKALEKLLARLFGSEKIGAVSPLLFKQDGSVQEEYYMRFPNLWQVLSYHHPLWRPLVMRSPLKYLITNKVGEKKLTLVDQLPGAALMAKLEVWQKVGFLDEGFQFLFEDVDWSWRARKMGFELAVVSEAEVIHLGGGSWRKRLKRGFPFYRQFFTSLLLFIEKNYSQGRFFLFRGAIVFNCLTTFKFKLAFDFLKKDVSQKKLWS